MARVRTRGVAAVALVVLLVAGCVAPGGRGRLPSTTTSTPTSPWRDVVMWTGDFTVTGKPQISVDRGADAFGGGNWSANVSIGTFANDSPDEIDWDSALRELRSDHNSTASNLADGWGMTLPAEPRTVVVLAYSTNAANATREDVFILDTQKREWQKLERDDTPCAGGATATPGTSTWTCTWPAEAS